MPEYEGKDLVNGHLEQVQPGVPTTVEIVKKLAEAGKAEKIHVTLSRQIEEPQRAESPSRAHRFFSLGGFSAYLSKYGSQAMTVLADPDTGDMAAVLDEQTDDGYEVVTFSPRLHPLYAPWKCSYGQTVQIKYLARFIIANRSVVVTPAPDRLANLFKQVQVSKRVTLNEGTGADAVNGVMCQTKIQGREANQLTPLPETIRIECPMFVDSEPQEIQIDLLLEVADDETVCATLVSADADVKRVLAIQNMLERLRRELSGLAIVSLGRLNYRDWNYLRTDDPDHVRNVPLIEYTPEAVIRADMIRCGSVTSYSRKNNC
jgi:hypothetical protein